jgi:hypothetical protein
MAFVVRAWALLDLLVTGLLVLPVTAEAMLRLFHSSSGQELPPFAPIHQMMTTLAGLLGVVWALARLRNPIPSLVWIDVSGRCVVGASILWFVLARGAPDALLAFSVSEVGGALHQGLTLRWAAPPQDESGP